MSGQGDEQLRDPQNSERFVQLFAQYRDDLFGYIFSLVPHWSDAEDIFQQTSIVLWQKFGEFQQETDFRAWACRVAFNKVCNFRRVAGRNRLQFNDALLDQLAQERSAVPDRNAWQRQFLADCMAKLSDEQRILLRRAYTAGDTIKQLALELRRSPQTIYNRLNLIRRSLLECVKKAAQQQRVER